MVQELGVLLKNIKADIMLQQIKGILKEGNDKLAKQESEVRAKNIQESLVDCSNFLEGFAKILWVELEKDLSNLKEVKLQINKELKNNLEGLGITQDFIKLPESGKQIAKSAFIRNTINTLKENVSEHLMKLFQEVLTSSKVTDQNQSSKALEVLLASVEASGLIKYEYWGLLDFAYPINKMKSGHYCIMCISSTSSIMDEFARRVKLNENIIRHLSVRVNKFFEGKSHMMNKEVEEQSA
ncbi:30S ribosomal protein S6 [Wolbachia pipientis]|uniref:30S ribosomal protein S6 n=1 Tax=Wolbachia pipientis TaxID=955 RepID=UPI002030B59E|nr:30S ribosomal protein S6 [Wolbachia pipientis]MCM1001864.1 30S ribosomal protein S6 [Wolbachia pipientis]